MLWTGRRTRTRVRHEKGASNAQDRVASRPRAPWPRRGGDVALEGRRGAGPLLECPRPRARPRGDGPPRRGLPRARAAGARGHAVGRPRAAPRGARDQAAARRHRGLLRRGAGPPARPAGGVREPDAPLRLGSGRPLASAEGRGGQAARRSRPARALSRSASPAPGGRPVLARAARYIHAPPSTRRTLPVIQAASSEARKTAARPMSTGSPARPRGMVCKTASPWKRISRSPISERTRPGAITFTRTPTLATSLASTLASAFT